MSANVVFGDFGRFALVDLKQSLVKHVHAYPQLIVLVDGPGAVYVGGNTTRRLRRHQAILVPPWQEHCCLNSGDGDGNGNLFLALHLDCDWFTQQRRYIGSMDQPILHAGVTLGKKAEMLVNKMIDEFKYNDGQTHTHVNDSVTNLVLRALDSARHSVRQCGRRIESAGDYRIRRACGFMRENLAQAHDLNRIASVAGLSRAHFNLRFREVVGTAPGIFANELRMQRATKMLSSTTDNIGNIAAEIGFSEQSNFTRFFRNHVGLSPQSFRTAVVHVGETEKRRALDA